MILNVSFKFLVFCFILDLSFICATRGTQIGNDNITRCSENFTNYKGFLMLKFIHGNSTITCRLDTLRIDLERLVHLWHVTLFTIGADWASDVTLKLVRNEASKRTSSIECRILENDAEHANLFCDTPGSLFPDLCGIMANAVEIKAKSNSKPIHLHYEQHGNWLPVQYFISYSENVRNKLCLTAPGRYDGQTCSDDLETSYFVPEHHYSYKLGDTFTYCCGRVPWANRTCTTNGWSGIPPRCPAKISQAQGLLQTPEGNSQTDLSFFFGHTSYILVEVAVTVRLGCSEVTKQNEQLHLLVENLSFENVSWHAAKYNHTTEKSSKNESTCHFRFRPTSLALSDGTQLRCTDCIVKVDVTKSGLTRSEVSEVTIIGADLRNFSLEIHGCPPIDPYDVMPDEYRGESKDWAQLNRLLKEKPCRHNYQHDGHVTLQCNGTHWVGTAPLCKLATCKQPEDIMNGQWSYLSEIYNEVVYTCNPGFAMIERNGQANCNHELNKWENVPTCVSISEIATTQTISSTVLTIVIGVVVLLFFIVLVVHGYIVIKYKKRNDGTATLATDSDSYVLPETRQPLYADITIPGCNMFSENDYEIVH